MKWSGPYTVNSNDLDVNRIVSTSGLLRYMQDAANWQMERDGQSYDALFDAGQAFVLSKMRLSSYAPLYTHEAITVETWACPSRGMTFQRCYRILRGDRIIAEASSAWALVGRRDHRLHRVTELAAAYGTDEPLELDIPARIRVPEDVSLALVGERPVEYADIDLNGHLHNTQYADILCGYTGDMRGKRVIAFSIHYAAEALLGETLKVYHGAGDDGVHYLRTLRENGATNVEAEILMESLEEA